MTDTHTTAHIPDEAVQAAFEAMHPMKSPSECCLYDIKKAIIAALPHLSAPCAVEVKKLEWEFFGNYGLEERAKTSIGYYSMHIDEDSAAGRMFCYFHLTEDGDCTKYGEEIYSGYGEYETIKAAAQADFERRILSCVFTKPVDVAALLQDVRSGERDGFINTGKEPHGNDADLSCPCCGGSGHKDDAKPVDVAAVREQCAQIAENFTVKDHIAHDMRMGIFPEQSKAGVAIAAAIRALSAEPAQFDHIADVGKMVEALKETRIDLVVLSGNIADAAKISDKWEGMYDRVRSWIDRIDAALPAAPTTEAGK